MDSPLAQHVDRRALLATLTALEGERHPVTSRAALDRAEAYVVSQWRSWDLAVSLDEFSHEGVRAANLIARPARCALGPRLIIGAHLDTVSGSPGADDNASGVAALLELSRIAARRPWSCPVEFVAFALEEFGLVGSARYALALSRAREPVAGMLSLEMIGFTESAGLQHYPWFLRNRFPAVGNYLGLAGNRRSRALLDAVHGAMRRIDGLPVEALVLPDIGWRVPETRLSDHAPFWDRGYPALLITDTAFFRNPHYHQASDTVSTLDLGFLERVTRGLAEALEALAGPLSPPRRPPDRTRAEAGGL
jgi:hypothetical protein